MNTLWKFVKLNTIFVLIGGLVGTRYGYTDWQLYSYIVTAVLLTQMREATLFEEY